MQFLEENMGKCFLNVGVRGLSNYDSKSRGNKTKLDEFDCMKIKTSAGQNKTKAPRQGKTDSLEENTYNIHLGRGLIPLTYETCTNWEVKGQGHERKMEKMTRTTIAEKKL